MFNIISLLSESPMRKHLHAKCNTIEINITEINICVKWQDISSKNYKIKIIKVIAVFG